MCFNSNNSKDINCDINCEIAVVDNFTNNNFSGGIYFSSNMDIKIKTFKDTGPNIYVSRLQYVKFQQLLHNLSHF